MAKHYDFQGFTRLEEFGYMFTSAGEMRQKATGEPFKFEVKPGNRDYNQKHYEALGDIITLEIYKLLEQRTKLDKLYIHQQSDSFIFASKDYKEKEKLLCLIHGSGVVRAGQWARRLIINDDIDKGTQIPYIEEAVEKGFGVVVFNTNQNSYILEEKITSISGSESPQEHAVTVWNQFILNCAAKHIVIVAHSYGGVVTVNLAADRKQDFLDRVVGIYLTDSVHNGLTGDAELDDKLKSIGRNYVSSSKPVGELVHACETDILCVSAGHDKHEWTSWSASSNIFKHIHSLFPEPNYSEAPEQEKEAE